MFVILDIIFSKSVWYGNTTGHTEYIKNYFSLCLPQNGHNIQRITFTYNLFRYNKAPAQ
jgi:hypothetical protein